MTPPAISIKGLSKCYRLGTIGRHTLVDECQYLWHKLRGRDPRAHMGRIQHGAKATEQRRMAAEEAGANEFWALKDVSFDIQPGEVVGIIGRNGAGKSTLLKILSRITAPTEGEAVINGRVGSLLEVGTGFHPELTGRENVYMNGTILGMKKREIAAKFDEIVAFSEMEKFIDTPAKRYSSGMYVRLAFAVAAHLEPEILLVDEVLAVGDAGFQKKCLNKMKDASFQGRTVLFVSHNMPAITRLCTRGVLLRSGQVELAGTAEEAVSRYLSSMAESTESRTWELDEAPGTETVRLLGVSLLDAAGLPVSVAKVSDDLTVRLSYQVGMSGAQFRCAVTFCTQGTIAFSTMEPVEHKREQPGKYTSEVVIPAHLLAENEYTLNIAISASRGATMHHVKQLNVLSFQVVDPMEGVSARGDFTGDYRGIVRPMLNWKTAQAPVSSGECHEA